VFNILLLLFLDGVENGLHPDIVSSLLEFMYLHMDIKDYQVISITHQEKLLDLYYISNQSKILFKENDKVGLRLEYLSEFKIRKDQVLSRRYLLDAFESNPKIRNK